MTRLLGENLSEQTLAGVLWQVAIGLEYLHGAGVAHCDLKLSNLLLQRGQIVPLKQHRKYAILDSARISPNAPHLKSQSAALSTTWLLRSWGKSAGSIADRPMCGHWASACSSCSPRNNPTQGNLSNSWGDRSLPDRGKNYPLFHLNYRI